tara:strand:- start:205 stop:339 length:135 start_codon:yes stop_codon:yes gene_type:complete
MEKKKCSNCGKLMDKYYAKVDYEFGRKVKYYCCKNCYKLSRMED